MNSVDEIVAEPDEVETLPWWQSKLNMGVLAVAIALLCGALGWVIGNNQATPDPNPVDIGFLQDMRTHHEQPSTWPCTTCRSTTPTPSYASWPVRSRSGRASTSAE